MGNKILFLGNNQSGWENISAINPIDQISLTIEDPSYLLIEFAEKHQGKLVAGFISYEYGVKQLGLSTRALNGFPAAHFYAFNKFEKYKESVYLSGSIWTPFQPIISRQEYDDNYYKIKDYIREGDFYQLNYTHLLKSKTKTSPENFFQTLRAKNKVGYSAFMEGDGWAIHSLSPEQFINIQDKTIITRPIKGTIQRGNNEIDDKNNLKQLLKSKKEQAELYMIIDLLRNDLGKICRTGSVEVLKIKSIQKLEKVFHTYGLIKGKIKNDIHPIEILVSMIPGGSISGCPKKRACEIIYDVEPNARRIYTGTIGYIMPNGNLNFNIAIRTILQKGAELTLGVGGGITINSNNNDEYNETLAKAASLQP